MRTIRSDGNYFWGLDLSDSLQGAGGVGGLLAVSQGGSMYYPVCDNNGNITAYLDDSGNIVASYEYNAFGETISQSGSMANGFAFRFSTKYYDGETELYYYGYRFYSSTLRTWLNRDPIEEDGGLNLYAFCGNKGINSVDLLGQKENGLDGNEWNVIWLNKQEWHVWNCEEFNGKGTVPEYIRHFETVTFDTYYIPNHLRATLARSIVSAIGINGKSCWSTKLRDIQLLYSGPEDGTGRTVMDTGSYYRRLRVKIFVLELVEHPNCCEKPAISSLSNRWVEGITVRMGY